MGGYTSLCSEYKNSVCVYEDLSFVISLGATSFPNHEMDGCLVVDLCLPRHRHSF